MSAGVAIWLIGAVIWGAWLTFRIPGAVRNLTMINFSFWTGLMWPIHIPVMLLARLMKARPDEVQTK